VSIVRAQDRHPRRGQGIRWWQKDQWP